MSLPNLAVEADLSARGVDTSDTDLVAAMLAVASSVVRGATRSPVLSTTSTVTLWAFDRDTYLDLPGKPVTSVTTVTVDGTAVTDYDLIHGRLYRRCGWGGCEPVKIVATYTHGFAEVPANVLQLVCDLAIAGMDHAADGAIDPRVISEKIDDYSVTFAQGYESMASVFELPRLTRNALAAQFGGGAGMVSAR